MSKSLTDENCVACDKHAVAISPAERHELMPQLPLWQSKTIDGVTQLQRSYNFQDYLSALKFTNAIAELAEAANHHPVIELQWGKVTINWWTHTLNGLHRNDFILAAKCDQLYSCQ